MVEHRQPLADARRPALEVPLARQGDGDGLAAREDLREARVARAAVALVAELEEGLVGGAPWGGRDRGDEPGALAERADDLQRAAECRDAVAEAEQARAQLGAGAAAAVVPDLDDDLALALDDPRRDLARLAVAQRVRERLGDHRVDGDRDRVRQPALGQLQDPQRQRGPPGERVERSAEAALGQAGGVEAARELAQLGVGERRLLAHPLEQRGRPLRVVADTAQGEAGEMAEGEQALLRAVVEVAADPATLVVGGLDHAGARRRDLGLVLAQGDLVAAALDLGGRAGGEDRQRGELVLARVDPAAGEDAEVAEVDAADAAHRDREIRLEVLARDDRAGRQVRPDSLGHGDDVLLEHLRADGPGEVVLRALREPCGAAVPGGDDADTPRRRPDALRDERDLGVEGLGDMVRERAQERLADDARRPGRDRPQQVPLPGVAPGPGCGRLKESGQGSVGGRRTGARRW